MMGGSFGCYGMDWGVRREGVLYGKVIYWRKKKGEFLMVLGYGKDGEGRKEVFDGNGWMRGERESLRWRYGMDRRLGGC